MKINPQDSDLVLKARLYAIDIHTKINQMYDNEQYSYHLQMVTDVALQHIYAIPEDYREIVLAAAWLHDILEDCSAHTSYKYLKYKFGEDVAEIVLALTKYPGRGSEEMEDDAYYERIKAIKYADFVKLCDRFANMTYGQATKSRMFKKYSYRNAGFCTKLFNARYIDLIWKLLTLSGDNTY